MASAPVSARLPLVGERVVPRRFAAGLDSDLPAASLLTVSMYPGKAGRHGNQYINLLVKALEAEGIRAEQLRGDIMAALSLNVPVQAIDTVVNRELRQIVGTGWLHLHSAELSAANFEQAHVELVLPPSANGFDRSFRPRPLRPLCAGTGKRLSGRTRVRALSVRLVPTPRRSLPLTWSARSQSRLEAKHELP